LRGLGIPNARVQLPRVRVCNSRIVQRKGNAGISGYLLCATSECSRRLRGQGQPTLHKVYCARDLTELVDNVARVFRNKMFHQHLAAARIPAAELIRSDHEAPGSYEYLPTSLWVEAACG